MQKNYYQPPQFGGIGNNGYFYPYAPSFQPQQAQQFQQPSPPPMQLYAVNGIEGAKAYVLPPNGSVYLIDSDNPFLYTKEADAQGKCVLKAYSITEVNLEEVSKANAVDLSGYATKADIKALEKRLEATFPELQKDDPQAAEL